MGANLLLKSLFQNPQIWLTDNRKSFRNITSASLFRPFFDLSNILEPLWEGHGKRAGLQIEWPWVRTLTVVLSLCSWARNSHIASLQPGIENGTGEFNAMG